MIAYDEFDGGDFLNEKGDDEFNDIGVKESGGGVGEHEERDEESKYNV